MKLTKSEAGELANVSHQTIAIWHKKEGLPVEKKNAGRGGWTIDGAAYLQWYAERFARQHTAPADELTLEEERRRLTKEQADEKAINNAKSLSELIEIDHCLAVIDETAAILRATYAGIPSRIAPELAGLDDPAECRAVVRRELLAAQAVFADRIAKLAASPGDSGATGEDVGAAAATNGGRMGGRGKDTSTGKPGAGSVAN